MDPFENPYFSSPRNLLNPRDVSNECRIKLVSKLCGENTAPALKDQMLLTEGHYKVKHMLVATYRSYQFS